MRFSTASLLLLGFLCLSSLVESQDDDCLTINEIACTVEGFETLCELLELSGLDEVLAGNETFTVFAPLNEAFDALPEDLVESLVNSTGEERGSASDSVSNKTPDCLTLVFLTLSPTTRNLDRRLAVSRRRRRGTVGGRSELCTGRKSGEHDQWTSLAYDL
jgi:uncharacterized surface protein with fasciclin (FAS1) repeats